MTLFEKFPLYSAHFPVIRSYIRAITILTLLQTSHSLESRNVPNMHQQKIYSPAIIHSWYPACFFIEWYFTPRDHPSRSMNHHSVPVLARVHPFLLMNLATAKTTSRAWFNIPPAVHLHEALHILHSWSYLSFMEKVVLSFQHTAIVVYQIAPPTKTHLPAPSPATVDSLKYYPRQLAQVW